MGTTYFVVDHVSDTDKTDGLVESYQMIPVQYQQEDGTTVSGLRRLNFVYWPNIPHPFLHEEWTEDLVFADLYNPEDDVADDLDEEDDGDVEFDGEETEEIEDGEELRE